MVPETGYRYRGDHICDTAARGRVSKVSCYPSQSCSIAEGYAHEREEHTAIGDVEWSDHRPNNGVGEPASLVVNENVRFRGCGEATLQFLGA